MFEIYDTYGKQQHKGWWTWYRETGREGEGEKYPQSAPSHIDIHFFFTLNADNIFDVT